MIDAFLSAVPLPERVLGVETPFCISIDDATTGGVLPVPLIGAVDAIVVENGKPVIWELKTAAKKWSRDQTEVDQQCTAYIQAMREEGCPDVTAKLVITTKTATPAVQIEPVPRTKADERELAITAGSVLRAVEAGVDHPIRSWACRSCPFAGECRS